MDSVSQNRVQAMRVSIAELRFNEAIAAHAYPLIRPFGEPFGPPSPPRGEGRQHAAEPRCEAVFVKLFAHDRSLTLWRQLPVSYRIMFNHAGITENDKQKAQNLLFSLPYTMRVSIAELRFNEAIAAHAYPLIRPFGEPFGPPSPPRGEGRQHAAEPCCEVVFVKLFARDRSLTLWRQLPVSYRCTI